MTVTQRSVFEAVGEINSNIPIRHIHLKLSIVSSISALMAGLTEMQVQSPYIS